MKRIIHKTKYKDYSEVPIPTNVDPKQYTADQRRAEMFQFQRLAGNPWNINLTEMAKRYGKSVGMIGNDIKCLQYTWRLIGMTLRRTAPIVFVNSIENLQKQGDYYKAAKVMEMYTTYAMKVGEIETVPEQHVITHKTLAEIHQEVSNMPPTKILEATEEELDAMEISNSSTKARKIDI